MPQRPTSTLSSSDAPSGVSSAGVLGRPAMRVGQRGVGRFRTDFLQHAGTRSFRSATSASRRFGLRLVASPLGRLRSPGTPRSCRASASCAAGRDGPPPLDPSSRRSRSAETGSTRPASPARRRRRRGRRGCRGCRAWASAMPGDGGGEATETAPRAVLPLTPIKELTPMQIANGTLVAIVRRRQDALPSQRGRRRLSEPVGRAEARAGQPRPIRRSERRTAPAMSVSRERPADPVLSRTPTSTSWRRTASPPRRPTC